MRRINTERITEICTRLLPTAIQLSAGILAFLGLYLLLQDSLSFLPYIQSTDIQKLMVVVGELLIMAVLGRQLILNPVKTFSDAAALLFFFLLMNSLLLQPLLAVYLDPYWEDIPVVKRFRSYFLNIAKYLYPITIASGLLAWKTIHKGGRWLKSQFKQADSSCIPDSEQHDESKNQGTPGSKSWLYLSLFLIAAAAGLYLRFNQLNTFITDDETHHLAAAMQFLRGEPWKELRYTRGLYTVTAPLILGIRLFGTSLSSVRTVSIIFNTLAVVPLYFLMRRTNKTIALISVSLYLLNPWMIETSRIVREYAFAPFYIYTTALVMQVLYDSIPEQFNFPGDISRLINFRVIGSTLLLVIVLYYVLFIDSHATSKVILGVYLAFGLLIARKINWHNRRNLWLILIVLAMIGIFLLNTDLFKGRYSGLSYTGFSNYYLSFFLTDSPLYTDPVQQWNYGYGLSTVFILLLAVLSTHIRKNTGFAGPLAWISFLITLIVFSTLMIQGLKPRYATHIQVWFIPVIAIGFYAAFLLAKSILKNPVLAGLGLILLFFNFPHITSTYLKYVPYSTYGYSKSFFDSGNSAITNEYFSDLDPAYIYLSDNMSDQDTLVTTTFIKRYLYWKGIEPTNLFLYWYDLDHEIQSIFAGIRSSDEGWIALDYERGFLWSSPLPLDEFEYAGKHVDWKGWYGDVLVYHWYLFSP